MFLIWFFWNKWKEIVGEGELIICQIRSMLFYELWLYKPLDSTVATQGFEKI